MQRRAGLTARGLAFLCLGAVLVLVGMGAGYPDVIRIGVLLLCVVVLCLFLTRAPSKAVRATRVLSPRPLRAGVTAQVDLTIHNDGRRRLPPGELTDHVPEEVGHPVRAAAPAVPARRSSRLGYELVPRRRGRHTLGPAGLRITDPFGVAHRTVELGGTDELLVLPYVENLGADTLLRTGAGTDGATSAMIATHGLEAAALRQYVDGDDLRMVHWPATAHHGEVMVRQADRPSHRTCVLLLDTRSQAFRQHPVAFEWAVSALASVAHRMEQLGFVIHLVAPRSLRLADPAHPLTAADVETRLAAEELGERADLLSCLSAAESLVGAGSFVVAALGPDLDSDALRVANLRRPGSPAAAFVLDPDGGSIVPELFAADWQAVVVDHTRAIAPQWSALTADNRTAGGVR